MMASSLSSFWNALWEVFDGFLETLDVDTSSFREIKTSRKDSVRSQPPVLDCEMKFRLSSRRSFTSGADTTAANDNLLRRYSTSLTNHVDYMPTVENYRSMQLIGHRFHSTALEADTFCDFCTCPIYSLGLEPICQRCTDCHITCHPRCVYHVRVSCHPDPHGDPPSDSTRHVIAEHSQETNGIAEANDVLQRRLEELSVDTDSRTDDGKDTVQGGTPDAVPTTAPQSDASVPTAQKQYSNLDPDHTIYYTAVSSPDEISSLSLPSFSSAFTLPQPNGSAHIDHTAEQSSSPRLRKSRPRNARKTGPVALVSRHSFLAGTGANAPPSSRLTYEFSSLDRRAIVTHGIEVREVTSADESPKFDFEAIPEGSMTESTSTSVPCPSIDSITSLASSSTSEFGYASVMQSTAAYLKNKPRRKRVSGYTPSPSPMLYPVLVGPRGRLPYSAEELTTRLSVFNANEFGLQSRISASLPPGECEGQVRIHINLLRPIRMLLTVRPVSIFDLVGQENVLDDESDCDPPAHCIPMLPSPKSPQQAINGVIHTQPKSSVNADVPAFSSDANAPLKGVRRRFSKRLFGSHPQSSTFWLPRGSTKLLYVRLSTTVNSVITMLLDRFQIADNPQKFALYEHTIEGEHRVSVRKLFDDESPLGLVLRWTEDGPDQFNKLLGIKRLVLQENETGDIEWTGFSLPELNTFLSILTHEEADYRRRIEMKYEAKRNEVLRLMAQYEQSNLPVTASQSDELNSSADSHPFIVKDPDTQDASQPSSADTTPTHSPKPARKSTSTLPGFFFTKKKDTSSTLFKPSAYKEMKKAEKARQKLEKERLKAEAKRLKSEARQQDGQHPPRRLFAFAGRPSLRGGTTTPLN